MAAADPGSSTREAPHAPPPSKPGREPRAEGAPGPSNPWSRWRAHRRRKRQRDKPLDKPRPETLEGQVADIYDRFVTRTTAEVNGMWEMLGSRKRLLWVNFLAGLSRGIGFFLGVTLVGGLVIGGTALVLDTTAEMLGWKDVTFAGVVRSLYGKFQEVQSVIETMESGDETVPEPEPFKAPTLESPLQDAFPTSTYPFEDGPLPGRPPPLDQPPFEPPPR